MNHSMSTADRGTHFKIVCVGLLSATLFAAIGLFAHVHGDIDLGTEVLVKASAQPTSMSGHLPVIR